MWFSSFLLNAFVNALHPLGEAPAYLKDVYKLDAKTEGAFNVGMP